MKRIGITGQAGFVGTHLFNLLNVKKEVKTVPFEDSYFESPSAMSEFVKSCDVIVHLAAVNRCDSEQELYDTNISLVNRLIAAMDAEKVHPHIIFSSSTQEERDNVYGKSKREGRELLSSWAKANGAIFTGLVIPNVYGPFGRPFHNSVIATFCHQLTHDEQPHIQVDGLLKLVYVGELAEEIFRIAMEGRTADELFVPHTAEKKVSEILSLLESFKTTYLEQGTIPRMDDDFERNLFNTFRSFINHKNLFPVSLKQNIDERGSFVEVIRLLSGGQMSFSTTKPGITRGNHYHTRKAERFVVVRGKALVQMRRIGTEEVIEFELSGENPSYVDMPVWYTHNIKNVGRDELLTLFWINEPFNPNDADTYIETV